MNNKLQYKDDNTLIMVTVERFGQTEIHLPSQSEPKDPLQKPKTGEEFYYAAPTNTGFGVREFLVREQSVDYLVPCVSA